MTLRTSRYRRTTSSRPGVGNGSSTGRLGTTGQGHGARGVQARVRWIDASPRPRAGDEAAGHVKGQAFEVEQRRRPLRGLQGEGGPTIDLVKRRTRS